MTAIDLLRYEFDDLQHMLTKVYEGMDEPTLDRQICAKAMTPRDALEHLAEAYKCVVVESSGAKYEWGSYKPADQTWPGMLNEVMDLRGQATALCLDGSDDSVKRGYLFIVGHDHYHVGQLCLARLEADADWDPYCIYQL